MIFVAIFFTLFAVGITWLVSTANEMSSAPGDFQGGWFIALAWLLSAGVWAAWWLH